MTKSKGWAYALAVIGTAIPLSFLNMRCESKGQYEFSLEVNAHVQEQDASDLIDRAWRHMYALGAREDVRVRPTFEELADTNQDGTLSEKEARDGIAIVYNPSSPVGQLWFDDVRGRAQDLDDTLRPYRHWQPIIDYLMDTNGDGRVSQSERNRAARRVY